MIDDERPDAPQEGDAPQDAEPSPSADPGEAPDADAPNESAPGHVDPETVQDAEPSGDEGQADAPNESAPGHAEPAAEGEEGPAAAGDEPAAADGEPAAAGEERPRRDKRQPGRKEPKEEVVPGAHLEPDLVLDEARKEGDVDEYADRYATDDAEQPATDAEQPAAEAPSERSAPRTALDLAADARYQATGKRKTSVARVILKPGDGAYSVNGRSLEDYFPRAALQKAARQPLQTAGFEKRMDVVAKLHGGGISAQAGALRHGVARALVEADPALRVELKRRGYLSRDDRAKERKKAGLKKARKRPQFSKR